MNVQAPVLMGKQKFTCYQYYFHNDGNNLLLGKVADLIW